MMIEKLYFDVVIIHLFPISNHLSAQLLLDHCLSCPDASPPGRAWECLAGPTRRYPPNAGQGAGTCLVPGAGFQEVL